MTAGTLTIGTDNPAFPPYFLENDGGAKTDPWELGDPTNGHGFESAVAYAIAEALGFPKAEVTWIVVPFTNSIPPGAKDFDIYLTQVSFKPERAGQAVDLSDGYYDVQPVRRRPGRAARSPRPPRSPRSRTSCSAPRSGTTSSTDITSVIAPTKDPKVYDTNDAAIEAVKNGQIDGIVVDLPTAFFVTAVQLEDGTIVGTVPTAGRRPSTSASSSTRTAR